MAKGKAIEFRDLVKAAEAQKPPTLARPNFTCEVNFDGQATISAGTAPNVLRLDPNDALLLGQWLVDNFKSA